LEFLTAKESDVVTHIVELGRKNVNAKEVVRAIEGDGRVHKETLGLG
jgi:hypothetical protein